MPTPQVAKNVMMENPSVQERLSSAAACLAANDIVLSPPYLIKMLSLDAEAKCQFNGFEGFARELTACSNRLAVLIDKWSYSESSCNEVVYGLLETKSGEMFKKLTAQEIARNGPHLQRLGKMLDALVDNKEICGFSSISEQSIRLLHLVRPGSYPVADVESTVQLFDPDSEEATRQP